MPASFLIRIKPGFQEIREEKEPEDNKNDKEFDQDDYPEPFPDWRQVPETVQIKAEYPWEQMLLHRLVITDTIKSNINNLKAWYLIKINNIKRLLPKYL